MLKASKGQSCVFHALDHQDCMSTTSSFQQLFRHRAWPPESGEGKHQVQWNRRNLRTWIVDVGLSPVAKPQDAWWRSLCPATCLQPRSPACERNTQGICLATDFPQRTYTDSSIRRGMWRHWSPQCPSHHLCVLELPPPRSNQEVIRSQVPPQHLAWRWPNKSELRLQYFIFVTVFISGPKSSRQKCLFPCWPLRTASITSHTPEGCPTPPVT